jgi:hypothetical protein
MQEGQGAVECRLALGTAGDGKMNGAEKAALRLRHREQGGADHGEDGQEP